MDRWPVIREGRPPRPSPVQGGKEHEVEIEETGSLGDGLARIEKFVVFVPGAKPGDRVRVNVTKVGFSSANAQIIEKHPKLGTR